MNENSSPDVGYLIVKVSTARGAIPLEGAAVTVRSETADGEGVLYSLSTNQSGQTERVSLAAPARASSESPGAEKPYATYSIDVFKEGYIPMSFRHVPIFSSILSIQPAVMIPAPEGERDLRYPPTESIVEEEPYGNLRTR